MKLLDFVLNPFNVYNSDIAIAEQGSELATPQTGTMAKYATDDLFDKFVTSYLPRLQLFDSNSNDVKKGNIPISHYGLKNANTLIDLGGEVELFVCSMRLKALDLRNDEVKSFFNPAMPEFLTIRGQSEFQNSNCLCGPEFLVYIPRVKKFATFFMSSKTMRREAPNVKNLLNKACLLRSRFIEKGKFAWYGPVATAYTSPLEMPSSERLSAELESFNNPPESQVEAADSAEAASADRPR